MSEEDVTHSPDLRIRQLEEELTKAEGRIEKLFAAYEDVKRKLDEKSAIIDVLEQEAIEKEIEREAIDTLLSDKDSKIHDLELEGVKASQKVKHLQPELEKMEEMYTRESARLGRVFEVAEDLDEALAVAKAQLSSRDDWYAQHMNVFEDLNKAIQTRYDMIDAAIEAIRDQELKRATFKERMDEVLDAASEAQEESSVDTDDDSD
ncbi:MAG TPA: hypothetical protein QGF70_04730, partial [Candidatus Thalassarchaeaceae archaeon]|nr:hypothetical protein [Candidatus Thalassarchaeaceae archaeon]